MAKRNEHIPALKRAAEPLPLRFSFKHLDFTNPKFLPSNCSTDYFLRLFQMLHRYSNLTVGDFIEQNNFERRHIIDFAKTTELDGFQRVPGIDAEQLGFHDGWQFGVNPSEEWNLWRAHGILINDVFYVIWLDHEHKLFPK
jgi:hypothetical protein